MARKRIRKLYTDHAHGWLEVPKSDLKKLELEEWISPCSYEFKGKVYLEEDDDRNLYLKVAKEHGWVIDIQTQPEAEGDSFIRQYPHYHNPQFWIL
jgi:hypothetical protein